MCGRLLKNIYYMKKIHDNNVNIIPEFNLLHDIINYSKRNKSYNYNYYPILHGCINTHIHKPK